MFNLRFLMRHPCPLSLPPASVRLISHADACLRPIWHGVAETGDALVVRTKFAAVFRSVLANPQEVAMAGRNAFYAQSGGVTAVINASACGVLRPPAVIWGRSVRFMPGAMASSAR